MRLLWLTPSDMLLEPVHRGLTDLGEHDVIFHWYDQGELPPDRAMLDAADAIRPHAIIYTSRHAGPTLASTSTFLRLRKIAQTIHILHDGSEELWKPLLHEYREQEVFTVTVNIDGNNEWESGHNDITALTPIAPSFYKNQRPLLERPIKFGFAGGYASPSRREIVEYLIEHAGLIVPKRNEKYGSYQAYADFLCSCQIALNVPFTGSDNASQVKGRVVEAGLAGCVLMEHYMSPISSWNIGLHWDFRPYESKEECAKRVMALLNDFKTMIVFSTNLRQNILQSHTPAIFWPRVLERIK